MDLEQRYSLQGRKETNMFNILFSLFLLWILWGFIKFAFKATWGLFKILGVIIAVIAFPVLLVGFIVGIGAFLIVPIVLLACGFGCIYKAVTA